MRLERREFLRILAAATLSGQLLIGSSEAPKPTPKPTPEKPRELPLGKKKLNQEIDNLPPSPIKTLLVQRIRPYYILEYPRTVNFGGLEISIQNPQVQLRTENINQVSGRFTFRESTPSEPLYPRQTAIVKIPYVGLILEREKGDIPPQNLAPDGTPLIEIVFEPGQPFYTGFSPFMEIATPDPKFVKPEYRKLYEVLERFIYLKEACSHLIFDLWTEEMVKKMRALGLRASIEAKRQDNTRATTAEVVSQSINEIHFNYGRIAAGIDLAAVIVASKAVEGTELVDPRFMDEKFKRVYPSIQGFSLGESPQDILYNSLRWALTTPEARLLHHVGNLDKIP